MAHLPRPTVDAIYAVYKNRNEGRHSQRLGASQAGESCDRRLWYAFRHVLLENFDGRVLRLFDTGHREELRVIDDLRAAGITVWDKDQSTGKQWEYTALDGHLVVKLDGVLLGMPEAPETPHVLECKTSNQKGFDKLEKEGVEKAKPVHYAQIQIAMGLADLTRAAYVVVNKNTDDVYVERVEYDDRFFKSLLLRCKRIIHSESPPDKISKDPSFFICRFCPFSEICHGEAVPLANCRTCVHSSPGANATWECANKLPMVAECGEHIFNPSLLESWAEPIDGDPGFVRYRIRKNNREFVNCADTSFPAADAAHYASRELTNCVVDAIGDPKVEAARTILDGKVVESKKGAA